MTTRQTARIRKTCVAVLFWHQKSTQKSAAERTQRTRAPRRAPRQARLLSHTASSLRPSERINRCVHLTASRALPLARRPAWAGEGGRSARRHQPPPPNPRAGPSRHAAEPVSSARTAGEADHRPFRAGLKPARGRTCIFRTHQRRCIPADQARAFQGALGAKPPFVITRSRTRRGARRMPLARRWKRHTPLGARVSAGDPVAFP